MWENRENLKKKPENSLTVKRTNHVLNKILNIWPNKINGKFKLPRSFASFHMEKFENLQAW